MTYFVSSWTPTLPCTNNNNNEVLFNICVIDIAAQSYSHETPMPSAEKKNKKDILLAVKKKQQRLYSGWFAQISICY